MCGITGILDTSTAAFFDKDVKTLFGMMLLNSLRGNASTGVFGVDRQGRVNILKTLGHPYEWNSYQVSDVFWSRMKADYNFVVAHGRLPTKGETVIANAHPFVSDHITLVHNGTLNNYEELNKKFKKNFKVDSQLLTYLIEKEGIDETLKLISGAWAMVYYDESEQSLNFIRNGQRPLHYAMNQWKDRMYFGSEEHYVKWGASVGSPNSEMKVLEFKVNTLYKIKKAGNKIEMEMIDKSKYYPGYTPSYTGTYTGTHSKHYHHGFGGYGYEGFEDDDETGAYVPPTVSKPKDNVVGLDLSKGLNKIILCVDEDLIFNFSHVIDSTQQSGGYIQIVYGYHENDPNIQVVVPTKDHVLNFSSLPKGTKCIGTIKSIFPTDIGQSTYHTRIALDNVNVYKETHEPNRVVH